MWNKCMALYRKYEEVINYIVVGGLTTLVSLVIYYGCVFTFLNPENGVELQAANVISWIGAVAFAYVTNRRFVFKSHDKNKFQEILRFVAARIATLLMDMAVMYILVTCLGGNDKLAKLVSQVVVIIGNYVLSKLFVFEKKA